MFGTGEEGVSNKVLFLDVDGVLNDHSRYPNGYYGIDHGRVLRLDSIIARTDCRIVLASAWRYMILGGAVSLKGFGYILAIHGAAEQTVEALLDWLPADRNIFDLHDRGKMAWEWLDNHLDVTKAVALDDGARDGSDLGYQAMGIDSVRPLGRVGLTQADADLCVRLLNGEDIPDVR